MKLDTKKLFEDLQKTYNIKVVYRDQHPVWKHLQRVFKFLENFTMTLGETVYFPYKQDVEKDYLTAVLTLCHEIVHVQDYRNSKPKILFYVKYGMPQLLAVFALLFPISIWFLTTLIFLLPFPAYWRVRYELKGYAVDAAFDKWIQSKDAAWETKIKHQIAEFLTGGHYYYCCYSKQYVLQEIEKKIAAPEQIHKELEQHVVRAFWTRKK